ncbi:MAG: hypothetical protein AAFX50_21545, partial [Acidobacteriota bacterium]
TRPEVGQQMRGLTIYGPVDEFTQARPTLSEVADGDRVEVEARIYNFSLRSDVAQLKILFEYELLDGEGRGVPNTRTAIGTKTIADLPALGNVLVSVPWDTAGLGPDDAAAPGRAAENRYRIWVTVDPDDRIRGEVHEGRADPGAPVANNEGYWPWGGNGFPIRPRQPDSHRPRYVSPSLKIIAADTADVAAAGDGALEVQQANSAWRADRPSVDLGCHRVRYAVSSSESSGSSYLLTLTETVPDAPGAPERIVSSQIVPGLVAGVTPRFAFWCPGKSPHIRPGSGVVRVRLTATVAESTSDPVTGNAEDSVAVDVYTGTGRP